MKPLFVILFVSSLVPRLVISLCEREDWGDPLFIHKSLSVYGVTASGSNCRASVVGSIRIMPRTLKNGSNGCYPPLALRVTVLALRLADWCQ